MARLQEQEDRQTGGRPSRDPDQTNVEFASVALNHPDLFERTRA